MKTTSREAPSNTHLASAQRSVPAPCSVQPCCLLKLSKQLARRQALGNGGRCASLCVSCSHRLSTRTQARTSNFISVQASLLSLRRSWLINSRDIWAKPDYGQCAAAADSACSVQRNNTEVVHAVKARTILSRSLPL